MIPKYSRAILDNGETSGSWAPVYFFSRAAPSEMSGLLSADSGIGAGISGFAWLTDCRSIRIGQSMRWQHVVSPTGGKTGGFPGMLRLGEVDIKE